MNILQSKENPCTSHGTFVFVPAHPCEEEVMGSEAARALKFKIVLWLAQVDAMPEDKQH